jgi:hypothetical protein
LGSASATIHEQPFTLATCKALLQQHKVDCSLFCLKSEMVQLRVITHQGPISYYDKIFKFTSKWDKYINFLEDSVQK